MTTTALSEVLSKLRQLKVPNWPAGRILGDIADEIESALASAEPVAWSSTEDITDDDGCPIGTDEPRVVWGSEHPDPSETWFPLYGEPMLVTHDAQPAAKVEAPRSDSDIADAISGLEEAYRFASTSPRAQEAINFAIEVMSRTAAPTPASVPDGLTVDIFYLGPGDDAFVCEIHGKATIEVIAEIETEIRGNPLEEFEKYGAGTYRLSASYFPGQYGEFGRCELAPGYEIDFISHTPIPADEEPTP